MWPVHNNLREVSQSKSRMPYTRQFPTLTRSGIWVWVACLFFFSFPFPCNEFCPFVSQRKKEKKKKERKVPPPQGHRPHQGTLHSILKRAGNTLVIYWTKAVIFFSLLHSLIQVQCSSCASLQVETRNCCVCASVCPSVLKPQRLSAHVEV